MAARVRSARRSPPPPSRICLIGFMGSGKSTVGRLLAARLGYRFLDLDERIEQQAGRPIRDIFLHQGEEGFRELEHRVLLSLAGQERLVIAAGGGAPIAERNRTFFREAAFTVYLDISFQEFERRVGRDPSRPLADRPPAEVSALYERRRPIYRRLGVEVSTDRRTPLQVVEEILEILPARPA